MTLKLIKIEPKLARVLLIAVAITCVAATWFFIRWNFANAVAERIDLRQPESRQVVDWLLSMAPSDPQTHYASASLLEKTFDPEDLAASLREYELTAALAPYNYITWINLGKARNLNGDTDGAAMAYARALELAPHYAAVQWAYGNFLLRQGRDGEGFSLVAKAATANPEYAQPAVLIALEILDGDINELVRVLGNTDTTNIALVWALTRLERFDESFAVWSKLASAGSSPEIKKLGETLSEQMISAKQFKFAARISADLIIDEAAKPMIGQIANGGFEDGVKQRGANIFEWQISDGAEPQIALSDSQKRSGKYGLFILFNSFQTADFRSISQTVAVEPDVEYEFETFYRSDLETNASLKWEIADAATTSTIAKTAEMKLAGDWTLLTTRFKAPTGVDGIVVRLAREGCIGPACRIAGRLSFDDFSLRRL